MKKLFLLAGLVVTSTAYAELRSLPPVVNSSNYTDGSAYLGGSKATGNPMLKMSQRLNDLQTEIQQLRGLLEEQTHEIGQLKKRQQNGYVDTDTRLRRLEATTQKKTSKYTSPVKAVVAEPAIAVTVPAVNSYTAVAIPVAVVEKAPTLQEPVVTNVSQVVVAEPELVATQPKLSFTEKAAFDEAFAAVKNSQYQESIQLLSQFLVDYPHGRYSDNATFWLASVYKIVNETEQAKTTFQTVFVEFPESEKAAMSILKLADIYAAENDYLKAGSLYTQVITDYDGSTAAGTAAEKLQKMGQ